MLNIALSSAVTAATIVGVQIHTDWHYDWKPTHILRPRRTWRQGLFVRFIESTRGMNNALAAYLQVSQSGKAL